MSVWKKLTDWYQGNNDREFEPPRGGFRRVGYILVNYAGKLIAVNVLFILSCLPIITIPAALSAVNCYIGKIFRIGYGMEIADFVREFKRGMVKYIPLGLLIGLLAFYAYYLLSLAGNFPRDGAGDVLTGIGIGIAVIGISLGSWCFVLTSMLDLPVKYLLKDAVILLFVEWKRSFLAAAEQILFWALMLGFAPYSVFFIVIFGFSVLQLTVCATLIPAVKKRIVEPFEKETKKLVQKEKE